MDRALEHATTQFEAVKAYMQSLGIDKPIHIGETGWASISTVYTALRAHMLQTK